MTVFTAVVCLLAAGAMPAPDVAPAPVYSPEAAPEDRPEPKAYPKTELWAGLSGGFRPDAPSGGGGGWLGFTYLLHPVIRFEVNVGLGTFPTTQDLLTPIRIGVHVELPRQGPIPYLWVALAHNHEVKYADAARNPIPTVLGLSEDGVVHRTGIDTGLGVLTDLPILFPSLMKDTLHTRLGLRLSVTHLLGNGPPRSLDLVGSVGVLF